ncbi:hypothetical protein Hanom_Chr11g00972141 [Helianthus anomalus]
MLHKPIDDRINVCRILARDHKATHFSICDRLQIPAHHHQQNTNKGYSNYTKNNYDRNSLTFDRSKLA